MNLFLRHYGGQLKVAVEEEACKNIDSKDNNKVKKKYEFENGKFLCSI